MKFRNILVLASAQAFSNTGPSIVVLLGGIIGAGLAPRPTLATLPVTLMVIGVACSTIPAALLMQRIGRRQGFILAAFIAAIGALLAALAITKASFALLCVATFMIGANSAFVYQYRFAAAESVNVKYSSRAISLALVGGLFAGYIGPRIATMTSEWLSYGLYTGSFAALAILNCVAAVILTLMKDIPLEAPKSVDGDARPLSEIFKQPLFVTSAFAAIVAYGVMSFIMTATPVHLHTMLNYDLAQTAFIIQSHVIAMYLPSLFSGFLFERFGILRMMLIGIAALLACIFVGAISNMYVQYWTALVLLGLGWNFLYVGATLLLTRTYRSSERFKAQAANDFGVFGFQALASLSAGSVVFTSSWLTVNMISLPFVLLILFLLLRLRNPIRLAWAERTIG